MLADQSLPNRQEYARDAVQEALKRAWQNRASFNPARATVEAAFTWEGCGRDTVAAYEAALG